MRGAINALALVVAMGLAVAAGLGSRPHESVVDAAVQQVRDASGVDIPCRAAQRIVSLSILSDRLLLALTESERLVATSTWSRGDWSRALSAKPKLAGPQDFAAILALRPDLVLVAGRGDDHVQRLREAGVTVYCLGDLDGWETCQRVARDCAALLGDVASGERLLARMAARQAVLRQASPARPERAICCSVHDTSIFGGTVGSAYHDVLRFAGCEDAAAQRFSGWPTWTMEDLYALDPEIIVTSPGNGAALRRLPGADRLRARIIEVPRDALDDPGLGIIEAAEALRAALDSARNGG